MPPARTRRLAPGDRGWPPLLSRIDDPPPELRVRGDVDLLAGPAVAVVGARKASGLGIAMAERLGAGLAEEGIVVVSGLAIGVDAAAHRGALAVDGPTVAVLGGGLDVAAPHSNRGLARRIAREGCLASEHPDGVPPLKHHFPLRNRILAGLSRAVVVVEAGGRSGALITARLALAAGREVLAVPGHPLLAHAEGVNRLLVDGARPVRDVADVLEELAGLPEAPLAAARERRAATAGRRAHEGTASSGDLAGRPPVPSGSLVGRVAAALGDLPLSAEALAERVGSPLPPVLAALTELELGGRVRAHPGGRYARPPAPPRAAPRRAAPAPPGGSP